MKDFNYYLSELNNIDVNTEYAPTFQIKNGEGNGKTKNMNLNKESALILKNWLTENFDI